MFDRPDLTYTYDGSFDGFLCCVFEHYEKREMPAGISSVDEAKQTIFASKIVETDAEKAERVYRAIGEKISLEARELVDLGFLTCLPEREMAMLRFLRLGFKVGSRVMSMLTEDSVSRLQKAVKHLTSEAHMLTGLTRFSICSGVLVAVIEPRNHVLPLLEQHFCDRFNSEAFMVYDRTHKSALVYHQGKASIVDLEEYEMPRADPEEAEYRRLWRRFYDTIAIEGRYNPRCRMSHMPKRYWKHLTELNGGGDGALGAGLLTGDTDGKMRRLT